MPVSSPMPVLRAAVQRAVRQLDIDGVPDLELIRTRNPEHGDYSSSVAMKLARPLRRAPAQIAEALAGRLGDLRAAGVEPAAGRAPSQRGAGERVNDEFASINPTGPLHIGHGRGVVLGDTLCRLLEFTRHDGAREDVVNDRR